MLRQLRRAIARKRAAFDFAHLARVHPLRYLFIELTRQCNLSCVYCGSECSPKWAGEELDASAWIEVLGQIATDFNANGIMLAFTGGEPLLKPGVLDIFRAAKRFGFSFGMVSNGTLIKGSFARELLETGIGSISISIDAPPASNDALRGEGTTARAARGFQELRRAGFRGRLEAISTATKPAIADLDEMRRYLAGLRVPEWRLAPVFPIGRAAKRADLLPDENDLRLLLDWIRTARADGLQPSPEFGEECYLGDAYEETVRPYRFLCKAGLTIGGILRDGRIGACPELADCFVQGDIRTERLRDVWEERYQVFRDRSWNHRGACAACAAYGACRGGSLHLYPSLEAPSPTRCFYEMLASTRTPS